MVKSLSTLMCQVTDMNRAAEFYREVLRLKQVFISPGWGQFEVPGGGSIGLHPTFKNGKPANGSGWILGLEVESVLELRAALESAGRTVGEFHDVPGGVVIEFTDPDGNSIQAIQTRVTTKDFS